MEELIRDIVETAEEFVADETSGTHGDLLLGRDRRNSAERGYSKRHGCDFTVGNVTGSFNHGRQRPVFPDLSI